MFTPITNFTPAKSGLTRALCSLLAVVFAVFFMALQPGDSPAKEKQYKSYKKNQKALHRTTKRTKYRASKRARYKARKKAKKRARYRKIKRARNRRIKRNRRLKRLQRQASFVNPQLAKAQSSLKISPRYFSALKKFYAARAYKKAWYSGTKLNQNGLLVTRKLSLVSLDGLNQADFKLPAKELTKPELLADIKISLALARYAEQVQAGRLSPSKVVAQHDLKPLHPDLFALLKNTAKSKDPLAILNQLPPPHTQYKRLKIKLADLRTDRRLRLHDTVKLDTALRQAANIKALAREDRIIANMERWRWIPRQLGEKHIWVNLPSYRLLVKEMGKISFATKGIIGKISAPTPLISSKIKNIIINPFWHIPASVVASEILPKLQAMQSNYLEEQAIRITRRGGRIVDPDSVDWSKITNPRTYRFRQSPGKQNALGQMKVLFPNSHSIYLHDTNEPELFSKTSRAFSHGCIRLANPIGFADAIASYDDHLQSQMPGTLLGPRERWLKYKATLPVHLVYFTTEIDASGNLKVLPDIYGYDDKIISIFNGTNSSS